MNQHDFAPDSRAADPTPAAYMNETAAVPSGKRDKHSNLVSPDSTPVKRWEIGTRQSYSNGHTNDPDTAATDGLDSVLLVSAKNKQLHDSNPNTWLPRQESHAILRSDCGSPLKPGRSGEFAALGSVNTSSRVDRLWALEQKLALLDMVDSPRDATKSCAPAGRWQKGDAHMNLSVHSPIKGAGQLAKTGQARMRLSWSPKKDLRTTSPKKPTKKMGSPLVLVEAIPTVCSRRAGCQCKDCMESAELEEKNLVTGHALNTEAYKPHSESLTAACITAPDSEMDVPSFPLTRCTAISPAGSSSELQLQQDCSRIKTKVDVEASSVDDEAGESEAAETDLSFVTPRSGPSLPATPLSKATSEPNHSPSRRITSLTAPSKTLHAVPDPCLESNHGHSWAWEETKVGAHAPVVMHARPTSSRSLFASPGGSSQLSLRPSAGPSSQTASPASFLKKGGGKGGGLGAVKARHRDLPAAQLNVRSGKKCVVRQPSKEEPPSMLSRGKLNELVISRKLGRQDGGGDGVERKLHTRQDDRGRPLAGSTRAQQQRVEKEASNFKRQLSHLDADPHSPGQAKKDNWLCRSSASSQEEMITAPTSPMGSNASPSAHVCRKISSPPQSSATVGYKSSKVFRQGISSSQETPQALIEQIQESLAFNTRRNADASGSRSEPSTPQTKANQKAAARWLADLSELHVEYAFAFCIMKPESLTAFPF